MTPYSYLFYVFWTKNYLNDFFQIDTRVTSLPVGSPYTLLQGVTENGSPAEQLVKLNIRPSRTTATTFITATPAPLRRTRTSATAAAVFAAENASVSAAENVDVCDSTTKLTKRKLSMTVDDDESEDAENAEESVFAEENVSKKQKLSEEPVKAYEGSHWITGDLGKLCVIM